MGATSTHYDKHAQNGLIEFFYGRRTPGTDLYVSPYSGTVTEVAISALVKRTELYAVIRWRNENEPEFRNWFGAVTTLTWARGHENLCYRQEEESMGPCITNAPRKVLETLDRLCPLKVLSEQELKEIDILRPQADYHRYSYRDPERLAADERWSTLDPDRTARQWRAACWDQVIARSTLPPIKNGDTLRFAQAIHFKHFTETTFQVDWPARSRAVRFIPASQTHVRARITNWRNIPYSVIQGG